jgi:L-ascorbate metabolism protein UlaG (beta-lactamase superfamily)
MSLAEISAALEAYPPGWQNGDERAKIMASLDRLINIQIHRNLTDKDRARLNPIQKFYRKRVDIGLDKLDRTRVAGGVHVFKFYCSWFVMKSAQGTVAVDFCQGPINNGGEPATRDEYRSGFYMTPAQRDRLARLVDVSLITHRHHDHSDYSLSKRLAVQSKIVVGPAQLKTLWKDLPTRTPPTCGTAQKFGPVEIFTMLGSQCSQNVLSGIGTERIGVPNKDDSSKDAETVVYLFRLGGIVFIHNGENHFPADAWLQQGIAAGFTPNMRLSLGQFQGERSLRSVLQAMKPLFWLPLHEYEMTHDRGGNRTGPLMQGRNRAAFDKRQMMPLL